MAVVVPTYNELVNLPGIIQAIHLYLPTAEILVVDDDSPDGTGNWCQQQAQEDSHLRCLRRSGGKGYGFSILDGLRAALAAGYDIVATMDADFSHPPELLPALVGRLQAIADDGCDVAIGSRYTTGGRIEGWPLRRRLSSLAVNWLARSALTLKCRDCSGGYRAYRTSSLRRIDLESIESRGYSLLQELLWRLQCSGAKIEEVPIVFRDRELGKSKLNASEAFRSIKAILRLGVQNWFGKV